MDGHARPHCRTQLANVSFDENSRFLTAGVYKLLLGTKKKAAKPLPPPNKSMNAAAPVQQTIVASMLILV